MSFRRSTNNWIVYITLTAVTAAGCRTTGPKKHEELPVCAPPRQREIQEPNYHCPPSGVALNVTEPLTVNQTEQPEPWMLSLEEAVQITLSNSDIIRSAGGRVVNGPAGAPSVYDVALQEINPSNGVEAALSAFDARVQSNIGFSRDERAFNNRFIGGGATSLASNTADFNLELQKQAATGTLFSLRNITGYGRNNVPGNLFNSSYDTALEGEFSHPLLRGRGVAFNRIAGPNGGVGNYNGVVLARIRTDIALADFEAAVRTLIQDVENAYWQLYFAYRSLDARTAAYEATLASWRTVQKQLDVGASDGEREALARASFYEAKVAMQNALSGGTDNSVVGVYSSERTLRRLLGIPANDGRLIQPTDEPSVAKRIFGWQESLELALDRRVELRRQRWTIKQRENELLASKNFLLSRLDLTGLYRWRGFGDELLGNRDIANGSAYSDLWGGDLQGWQLGLQYSTTLGKRREHAAVRSAELQLARERSVLRNQEMTISNTLSGQFAEMERTYSVAQANFNRSVAERTRLKAAMAKYDVGEELLEFVLQAQQRTADADSQYHRTLVDYNLAVSNMHFNRGTYLDYMGVHLAEGPWSPDSYRSHSKEFRRFKPKMNYCVTAPRPVSSGTYSQTPPRSMMSEGTAMVPANIDYGYDGTSIAAPLPTEAYPMSQPPTSTIPTAVITPLQDIQEAPTFSVEASPTPAANSLRLPFESSLGQ